MKTGGGGEGRVGDGQKICIYRLASVQEAWQSSAPRSHLPRSPFVLTVKSLHSNEQIDTHASTIQEAPEMAKQTRRPKWGPAALI